MVAFDPEPRQRIAVLLGLPRRQIELINAVEKRLDVGRSQVAELLIDAGLEAVSLNEGQPPREALLPEQRDDSGMPVGRTAEARNKDPKTRP